MLRPGVVVVAVVLVLSSSCGPTSPVDPCAEVTCDGGRCVVLEGRAECWPTGPADLCASNPCASLTNSLCLVSAGTVRCECPDTRVEVGGSCVLRTPCTPNPCTHAHRTTCELVGGAASCRCDPGYAPEGDGCSAAPLWTCAQQHADGDAAEPDECPTLAKQLVVETPASRTLSPAGDHDWFRLAVTPGRLYSFTAQASGLPLLVEVFDEAAVTLLASDNRGAAVASVTFPATASQVLHVRVRAVRATDVGAYTAQYGELGVDDYVNEAAGALTLVPAAGAFSGVVQYAGDRDVVWLELPARTAVRLGLPDGGTPDLVVEVARPDGGARLLNPGEATSITTPTVESLLLLARGRNPRDQGAFQLELAVLGPDDHSDEPAFGTPLPADQPPLAGALERPGDVDSFSVAQLAGRLYRATWQSVGGSGSGLGVSVLAADGRVLGGSSGYGLGVVWEATLDRPAALRLQPYWSSGSPQAYTVGVEDLGFDDHGDVLASATATSLGTPTGGRLELANDVDTFSFTATAGRIVQASAAASSGSGSALRVRLFDAQGQLRGEGEGSAGALIAATGVHKVQVSRGSSSYATDVVAYTLTLSDLGADDHAATAAGATALTVGTPASGTVQYVGDLDAFAFTADAGHVYEVACTRAAGGPCAYQVKDPAGSVQGSSNSGPGTVSVFAASAGRWVVEVSSGSTWSPALGAYSLTVTDKGLEDHGSTPATATPLTLATATSGTLGYPQDVDVFSFGVVAGRIYAVTVSSSVARVDVRDVSGTVVTQGGYSGAPVSFFAPSTTTLYAFVSASYTLGSYGITVEDRGTDDHANTASGATALTFGTGTTGELQYRGDVDYFTVPVTAGHHHLVTCAATVGQCALQVEAGASVLASGYASANAAVSFKPPAPVSAVAVRVSSYGDTARYTVTVTDLGADDHGDSRADATALVLDGAATAGTLETSTDVDAFTVSAAAGEVVLLDCTTTSGSACALRLLDPQGSTVAQTYGGATARTGYLATSGTWLLEVRGNSSGTTGGGYTLAATKGSDDVTTTTALTLGTARTGTIDYVGDTDVFSLALTAGTAVSVTVTSGARVTVTPPSGGYGQTIYGGYTSTYTPTTTGTYTFSVGADYASSLAPYTLTVR